MVQLRATCTYMYGGASGEVTNHMKQVGTILATVVHQREMYPSGQDATIL